MERERAGGGGAAVSLKSPSSDWWGLERQSQAGPDETLIAQLENDCNYEPVPAEGWTPSLLITPPGASLISLHAQVVSVAAKLDLQKL